MERRPHRLRKTWRSHLFWLCYCTTCLALSKLVALEASDFLSCPVRIYSTLDSGMNEWMNEWPCVNCQEQRQAQMAQSTVGLLLVPRRTVSSSRLRCALPRYCSVEWQLTPERTRNSFTFRETETQRTIPEMTKTDPGEADAVALTFCTGGRSRSSASEPAFPLEAPHPLPPPSPTFYGPVTALMGC